MPFHVTIASAGSTDSVTQAILLIIIKLCNVQPWFSHMRKQRRKVNTAKLDSILTVIRIYFQNMNSAR